jgi:hypothetical protein
MNRFVPMFALAGVVLLAACGGKASASSSVPSPSPNRGAQFRNGASGQLVQISGQQLILTGTAGDTVVMLTSTTTFSRTSVAALADVVPGACIVATGRKDASGALTATTVRISPKAASGCTAGGFGPGFGAGASPQPGASPRPTPSGVPNAAFVAGEVTAANGVSITVLTAASGSQVITVPTTASVTKSATATTADLTTGECILATGPKDASGAVQAATVAITPAGPSGTCTTGFGGRGGGRGGAAPTAAPGGG